MASTGGNTLSQLRLLILSPHISSTTTPSPFPPLLKYLTSAEPSEDIGNFAGYTSHTPISLNTKYYNRDVSIWCDELPSISSNTSKPIEPASDESKSPKQESQGAGSGDLEEWKEQMLSDPAREVRQVIGGIIVILPVGTAKDSTEQFLKYIEAANALREAVEDDCPGRDVASVVLLQPETVSSAQQSGSSSTLKALTQRAEALSNDCIQNDAFGWDIVHWTATNTAAESASSPEKQERNEFGEKTGVARIFEVLQSVDWSADAISAEDLDDAEEGLLASRGRNGLDSELQQEMLGLKLSMMEQNASDGEESGEDVSIEQIGQLHGRVMAIKEAAAEMSGSQKEAFAQREIDKIMKEL